MKVELRGLTKSYPGRRGRHGKGQPPVTALSEVSLDICSGEFVTIVGPSGCGKSSLLACIAGLAGYQAGSITVGGTETRGPGPERAMVFQAPSLLPWRTVRGNVAYGLQALGGYTGKEVEARVTDALHLVGLAEFEHHYPHQLSGGMQQRTNLARALAVQPAVLLLDEPFGALDAITRERLQDELPNMAGAEHRTTIFVTHDIEEAVYLGDRVVIMSPRPGRVTMTREVPLPRPRDKSARSDDSFQRIARDLRRQLDAAGA